MKCAVIILNWNGEKMLRQFLPSVVRYTLESGLKNQELGLSATDIEVIVADNGSTDNSLQILQDEFPTVRVLDLQHNYGFAEGYNRAIAQVEAEYVVLLNSDVEVTENWLSPILSYLDENQDVVAVQPKILKWSQESGAKSQDSMQSETDATSNSLPRVRGFEHAGAAGGFMDCLGYPYCRGRIMDYVEEDRGQYDNTTDIFWASGACLAIRREAYLQNGGLDADFFAHMEEIDLCWRLNARGYRLVCLPESTVYHLGGGSLPYNNPRKTFLNFRNNLLMIYKNMPQGEVSKVLFIRFFMDYTAAFMYLLKGQWSNFTAVCKARWAFLHLRKQFASKRAENLRKTTVPYPTTIIKRSIIWDFYVRDMRH